MKGIKKKLCPLLLARGVFFTHKDYKRAKEKPTQEDDSWLKICIGECPLGDCIYEKAGKIIDEDREALEKAGAIKEEV